MIKLIAYQESQYHDMMSLSVYEHQSDFITDFDTSLLKLHASNKHVSLSILIDNKAIGYVL